MTRIVDDVYDATGQLFGAGSGIPWWAWALAVAGLLWKMLVPERGDSAAEGDAALLAAVGGRKALKKMKKKK